MKKIFIGKLFRTFASTFALVFAITNFPASAFASTQSGFDTLSTEIPFAIKGDEVMDMSLYGLAFPGANGTLNATTLTTLVNLLNTNCAVGAYLTKTGPMTFACTVIPPTTIVSTIPSQPGNPVVTTASSSATATATAEASASAGATGMSATGSAGSAGSSGSATATSWSSSSSNACAGTNCY